MSVFHFKHFSINQSRSALKVGTDAMVFGTLISCENKLFGLDIGTGTGVLSLMVAQKNPNIQIDAIELDSESAKDCYENFNQCRWKQRLNLIEADFLTLRSTEKKYDLIFSNPPYFENSQENTRENKTLARHTKSLPFHLLFEKVATLLDKNGSFWIVLPFTTKEGILTLAESFDLFLEEEWVIEGKPNQAVRIVLHFQNIRTKCTTQKFLIRTEEGNYSEQYRQATENFHGKAI